MPEMNVNDCFSTFHCLCNFLEARYPISAQCYQTYKKIHCKDAIVPYKVGEEILYKHGDHKDLAIIDKTYYNQDKKALMVDV